MLKKIIPIYIVLSIVTLSVPHAGWISSVGSALKSVGSTAIKSVKDIGSETVNAVNTSLNSGVSLEAAAQLDYCRNIAAVPGGVNTLEYQRQCGNMTFVCQQVRLSNPQASMDPYCATVSGMGQMMGPWGGTAGTFMSGVNSQPIPANTDPAKIGWSVSPPPPYGLSMGMSGAYGIPLGGSNNFSNMLATRTVSRFFNGYGGGSNSRSYSSDYLEEDD